MKEEDVMTQAGAGGILAAWHEVAGLVTAPEAALPWLDRFYEPAELALLRALGEDGLCESDALEAVPELAGDGLQRARRRKVVAVGDDDRLRPASFADRFESWMVFEGWRDLPAQVRPALVEAHQETYLAMVREAIDELRAGRPPRDLTGNDCFVLLAEAEAILRAAERVFVRPCYCRRASGGCGTPVDVCLWIDDDEGGAGWEISRERGLELLHEADRAGLMFTANDPAAQATWVCCCCADCCEPILAAERLGVGDVWPRRRYLAAVDPERCSGCGTCLERCPFEALVVLGDEGVPRVDDETCRGCGVCATGCPETAIGMAPR
jgi:Pyruvate/2-oxoacid:ferredoxin oxidoreductase delta subunit